MKFSLAPEILTKYPQTQIGYIVADIQYEKSHPLVDNVKARLETMLKERQLTTANFAEHPDIAGWRRIYREDFGVKPNDFRSSVEALVRRIVRGQGLWNISVPVDIYCCVSVEVMLPIGGYDLNQIDGDIELRFGRKGEVFFPLGTDNEVRIEDRHVVYADQSHVLCWLWNFKDCRNTAITAETQRAVFFVDAAFTPQTRPVSEAVLHLADRLKECGAVIHGSGIANVHHPVVELC